MFYTNYQLPKSYLIIRESRLVIVTSFILSSGRFNLMPYNSFIDSWYPGPVHFPREFGSSSIVFPKRLGCVRARSY